MEKNIPYYCDFCDKYTNFSIKTIHLLPNEAPPEEYSFANCTSCNHPAVFIRENMGTGFENDDYYRIYPPHERHISFSLPGIVRDSYEEAVRCEESKAWLACAVMVGRTLEAVCKEFIPTIRTMNQGLNNLHEQGIISKEILDWSHELRFIRNIGAHASSTKISQQDAKEALDFLNAILEILYYLRPKFENMKSRRNLSPVND